MFYPSYERIKAFTVDQFNKILTGHTLSPLFKTIIKTPLDIARDIRDESRRQHNEDVLRRVQQGPPAPIQNLRPHPPQQPVPKARNVDLSLLPLSDDMLPETTKECSICLDEIEKDKMCYLNCNHFFHLNCVIAMCSSKTACSRKCPMCRIPAKKAFVSKPAFVNYFVEHKKLVHITI
jgi:hypothetical protein